MNLHLNKEEAELLQTILSVFVIKDRTGEIGIVHGANRFISTHICLKKDQRNTIKSVYKKLGLEHSPRDLG